MSKLKIEKGWEARPEVIMLCCGGKKCPTVSLDGNKVVITDDDNNRVTLSSDQANAISEAVERLTDVD